MSDNLHTHWAKLFIDGLVNAGVRDFVVSPGSRSTPLALAAVAAEATTHVVVDERAAAFFALGQARAVGAPSALICTSGSAAGHYMPAVLEAEHSHLPLIAITADRPWELTHSGANQTCDQTKLFSGHVRAFFELGEPAAAALAALPRLAAQVVNATSFPLAGPVHVNARFRKPLEPRPCDEDERWRGALDEATRRKVEVFPSRARPSPEAVLSLARTVHGARRGLVLLGPELGAPGPVFERNRELAQALAKLLDQSGFVCCAEATSGVRFAEELRGMCLSGLDDALASSLCERPPDVVLLLGAPPTSHAWSVLASSLSSARVVLLTSHRFVDPEACVRQVVFGEPALTLGEVAAAISRRDASTEFREYSVASATRSRRQDEPSAFTESCVARVVSEACPRGSVVMLGNSQVVRDFDRFAQPRHPIHVLHQRGLSGIDGLIAGACGTRSVAAAGSVVLAVLGDVSALHDVGALSLAAAATAPLVLVVVDNGGGRIFERLPVAKAVDAETLRRLFLTPPPAYLGDACSAFGLQYERVTDRDGMCAALAAAVRRNAATVIEAKVSTPATAVGQEGAA